MTYLVEKRISVPLSYSAPNRTFLQQSPVGGLPLPRSVAIDFALQTSLSCPAGQPEKANSSEGGGANQLKNDHSGIDSMGMSDDPYNPN